MKDGLGRIVTGAPVQDYVRGMGGLTKQKSTNTSGHDPQSAKEKRTSRRHHLILLGRVSELDRAHRGGRKGAIERKGDAWF
jgi:hypothetical protein